jgi:hypothetical protein
MWIRDLTRDGDALTVGWLAKDVPFNRGDVPEAAMERLLDLVERASTNVMRGVHHCPFCERGKGGNAEVRVVHRSGERFVAPALVHHYIVKHSYLPPRAFVDALLVPARITWDEAVAQARCFVDGDHLIPGRAAHHYDCPTCGGSYTR